MLKSKQFLAMSIFSLFASCVCVGSIFCGDISIRNTFDFDSTSHFIVSYMLKVLCIVFLLFFVIFVSLFFLSDRIKQTKTVFIITVMIFAVIVSLALLVSYFRTDYRVIESIDVLTERKRSVETFDREFQKYLLNNAYYEYDDKYVLIKYSKIPGSTYTYVECLPWDDSDLNIEYHLECLRSDSYRLINQLHHEIYLRNLVYGAEEIGKNETYILFENTVNDVSDNDRYLNIIIEKEDIIYSVEIYTTTETIYKLGKDRIIDDIIQNYEITENQSGEERPIRGDQSDEGDG